MNWEEFLKENSIEYVTSGPNTKRGEVSVQCPFCGDEDPSQHMGINLSREAWGCHRNAEHRGKSPLKLIQALLGCNAAQARLTLAQYSVSDPDSLEGALTMLNALNELDTPEAPVEVTFPPEFKEGARLTNRFWNYLEKRGYNSPIEIATKFGLMFADTGRYKDRIIFPVYGVQGLVGWTGRAIIDPVSAPRYLASSDKVKTSVYGYEFAKKGGTTLFLVEGPFDALWINSLSTKKHVKAVALMGTSVTVPQFCVIKKLQKKFKNVIPFLDKDAYAQSLHIAAMFESIRNITFGAGVENSTVPSGYWKDPSDIPIVELVEFFERYWCGD